MQPVYQSFRFNGFEENYFNEKVNFNHEYLLENFLKLRTGSKAEAIILI